MVGAWVVEVVGDKNRISRGFYDFASLPVTGNRITLANGRGALDLLDVEHAPSAVKER